MRTLDAFFLPPCDAQPHIYTLAYCMWLQQMKKRCTSAAEMHTFPAENLLHSNTQAIFISFYRHKLSRVKQNNEIMSYIYSHTCTLGI